MYAKVNNLYAYDATWTPSTGGEMQTGKILFKDPTNVMELSDITFLPSYIFGEYFDEHFVGLKETSDSSQNDEALVIDSVPYWVRFVRLKYDGRTCIAVLERQ